VGEGAGWVSAGTLAVYLVRVESKEERGWLTGHSRGLMFTMGTCPGSSWAVSNPWWAKLAGVLTGVLLLFVVFVLRFGRVGAILGGWVIVVRVTVYAHILRGRGECRGWAFAFAFAGVTWGAVLAFAFVLGARPGVQLGSQPCEVDVAGWGTHLGPFLLVAVLRCRRRV